MSERIKLYGHNYTRPGIEPPEWYGVAQWRTTEAEAKEDMRLATMRRALDHNWPPSFEANHSRHRIDTVTIDLAELTRLREREAALLARIEGLRRGLEFLGSLHDPTQSAVAVVRTTARDTLAADDKAKEDVCPPRG